MEVSYKGTRFSGFQRQNNAPTIQGEIERAWNLLFPPVALTGSSRTDAGVHALQNYFHLDIDFTFPQERLYNLNAIISPDIVIKRIVPVKDTGHCRFDALSREYHYHIYQHKNPFLQDRAYFYPYPLNRDLLNKAAGLFLGRHDFTAFSKRNTQVNNFICTILQSEWQETKDGLVYYVKGNRFLRGMVRALVATMLKVGTGNTSIAQLQQILDSRDCEKADFAAPAKGLFLVAVHYPDNLL